MIAFLEYLKLQLFAFGPKVILAVLLLIIGFWVIKKITNIITSLMEKREVNPSLRPFFRTLINVGLKAMLIISTMGIVGIPTTSFVAVLGAAGLAIGMALSGTLQNFAGGVMILTLKPFKVGDFITGAGHSGTIHEIQIFNTIMKTGDNRVIIIPNAKLSNDTIINFSQEALRRVDMTFGIGYGDDIELARTTLLELIEKDERILKDPEPFIALHELADSSVNFVIRMWVNSGDYWKVYFDMNKEVYNVFNEKGLNIPFPQMDVHVHQSNN